MGLADRLEQAKAARLAQYRRANGLPAPAPLAPSPRPPAASERTPRGVTPPARTAPPAQRESPAPSPGTADPSPAEPVIDLRDPAPTVTHRDDQPSPEGTELQWWETRPATEPVDETDDLGIKDNMSWSSRYREQRDRRVVRR